MLKGFAVVGEESGPWLGAHKELSLPCPSVHPSRGAALSAAALTEDVGVYWSMGRCWAGSRLPFARLLHPTSLGDVGLCAHGRC